MRFCCELCEVGLGQTTRAPKTRDPLLITHLDDRRSVSLPSCLDWLADVTDGLAAYLATVCRRTTFVVHDEFT